MKKLISNYTPTCVEFHKHFQGMPGVTTHECEIKEPYGDFDGTVYVNGVEFVCMNAIEKGKYMVYVNNPNGHDEEQWVFGYYKSFARALNKVVSIVESRKYPKPIEIW